MQSNSESSHGEGQSERELVKGKEKKTFHTYTLFL